MGVFLDFSSGEEVSTRRVFLTFCRTAMFPGFVEEYFWRKTLLGKGSTLFSARSLVVNAAYATSHVLTAPLLATARPGATKVFRDPAFIGLAFALGLACTHAFIASGHRLYAPVILHAATVTLWLTHLGGERKLSPKK